MFLFGFFYLLLIFFFLSFLFLQLDVYNTPLDTGFMVFNLMIGMGELFSDQFETDIGPFNRLVYIKVSL
jgi:hypothetical protein